MNDFRIETLSGEKDTEKLQKYMTDIYDLHCQTIGAPPYDCPITMKQMTKKAMRSLTLGAVVLLYYKEQVVGYMGGEIGVPDHQLVEIGVRDFGLPRETTAVPLGIFIDRKFQGVKLSKVLTNILYRFFARHGYAHIIGPTKQAGDQYKYYEPLGYNMSYASYDLELYADPKRILYGDIKTILEKTKDFSTIAAWDQQRKISRMLKLFGRTSHEERRNSTKSSAPTTSLAWGEMIYT